MTTSSQMVDSSTGVDLTPRPAARRAGGAPLRNVPLVPPWAIVGVAAAAAIACGRFFADGRMKYGAAIILASIYAPLVFFDLPVAIALFGAVLYVKDIRSLSIAPNTMGVLVGLGFIGIFIVRGQARPVLREHRRLIIGTVLFLLWLTLSAAWAPEPGTALSQAGFWWLGGFAFLMIMGTATSAREVRLVALAFVFGGTVAAFIGLGNGSLNTAATSTGSFVTSTASQVGTAASGRLTGGGGDPNVQAAGFIAAMFLAIGLISVYRRFWARVGLVLAFVLITVAFFATESRGGLLALGVSALAALVLFPDQRRRLAGFVVLAVVVAIVAVATTPGLLTRITNFSGGTSGRSDIWTVAGKVFVEHPLAGVGLNNFQVVEPHFALIDRTISRVGYIAETPYPAHNTYLGLLAETGVIGLIGFLAIAIASLRAAWLAAREFHDTGRQAYAHLAQTALMGTIGMLTAIFFFSDGDDWRVWILLGLGPALLTLARSRAAPATAVAPRRVQPVYP
jgi:O-antigen ligase